MEIYLFTNRQKEEVMRARDKYREDHPDHFRKMENFINVVSPSQRYGPAESKGYATNVNVNGNSEEVLQFLEYFAATIDREPLVYDGEDKKTLEAIIAICANK